jgi:hypothetical protein
MFSLMVAQRGEKKYGEYVTYVYSPTYTAYCVGLNCKTDKGTSFKVDCLLYIRLTKLIAHEQMLRIISSTKIKLLKAW